MTNNIPINSFLHMAKENRGKLIDETELINRDLTPLFYAELQLYCKYNEVIYINLNGKPGTGKSTAAIALGYWIHHTKQFKQDFGIQNIMRTQYDYLQERQKPNCQDKVLISDEWAELESTGADSTVIDKFFEQIADLYGQQNVPTLFCSPHQNPNKNSDLQLDVYHQDKRNKTTYAYLSYVSYMQGIRDPQLLGYIQIDVKPILNKPWYKEYIRRKFAKMALLRQEKIFRQRDLDQAQQKKDFITELAPFTEVGGILTKDMIDLWVRLNSDKTGQIKSIVGEHLFGKDIKGGLDHYEAIRKVKHKMSKLNNDYHNGKLEETTYQEKTHKLQKLLTYIGNKKNEMINSLDKYIQLKKEYEEILQ